jgi:hypothetical protein
LFFDTGQNQEGNSRTCVFDPLPEARYGRTDYRYIIVVGQCRPGAKNLLYQSISVKNAVRPPLATTPGRTTQQANPIFAEQPAQRSRRERASRYS